MAMTEPQDLFLHEMGDILYAERQLLKTLPKLAKQAGDGDLRTSLLSHEEETREQITNLEQAFALIGEKAKAEKCPGILGILKEYEDFVDDEKPSAEVLNLFLVGAVLRAEQYEVAAYTGLIALARMLDEPKVAALLRKNLAQERRMARTAEGLGKQLAPTGA
jgi:ferritin-like metal-binding protein YciE